MLIIPTTYDHGILLGLSDDDHTQYLLANGSRNLGGNWNLGGYNLTNGGTITVGTLTDGTLSISGGSITGGIAGTFSGEVTANVFDMPTTANVTTGVINQNNTPLMHTYGTSNFFLGVLAGNFTTSGTGKNVAVGYNAMHAISDGFSNVCVGSDAGKSITSGDKNVCFGPQSGETITTAGECVLIGNLAGSKTNGTGNIAIGGYANTYGTGVSNVCVGYSAGAGVDGSSNFSNCVLVGASSGVALTSGGYNVSIGHDAMKTNTTGGANTIVGPFAARDSGTDIDNNVFIGGESGRYATGDNNVFIGYKSGTDETGSDTLLIDCADRTSQALSRTRSLLYGLFYDHASGPWLGINGDLSVGNSTTGRVTKLGDGGTTNYSTFSATGNLLLPAGAAAAGRYPIKFQAGTALTTPETGAMEFHTNRFWITNKNARKALDRTSDVALSTETVSDTTDETTVFTGLVPANSLIAGNILKLVMSGEIDEAAAADTCTIRVKMGGVTMATIDSPGTGVSAKCWSVFGFATLRSVGATGSMAWHLDMSAADSSDSACYVADVDTTAAENITVTAEWNNAKAGNVFTLTQGFIEYKN